MKYASLVLTFLLAMVAIGPSAAAAEEPVLAPSSILEAPMTCPSAVDTGLGLPLAPIAAGPCPYGKCQVNSDCFTYCCSTYGACGGDSLCRRLSGQTCGMCLC